MANLWNRDETDTGTGKRPNVTEKNGYTQYYNPVTGTTTYGQKQNNGDVIYDPRATTTNRNGYLGLGNNGPRGDSGASGGGEGWSGPSYNDDIVNRIRGLLEEQKAASDKYYKGLYNQALTQNRQESEAGRNAANLNYMRGNRYLDSMYGNEISGQGLSNRARNNTNWQNNLATIRQNYVNNNANALAQYNTNRANAASQLAQGWYNYILPVYTNRQAHLDELAYQYR